LREEEDLKRDGERKGRRRRDVRGRRMLISLNHTHSSRLGVWPLTRPITMWPAYLGITSSSWSMANSRKGTS
jgi:hypothetical protein